MASSVAQPVCPSMATGMPVTPFSHVPEIVLSYTYRPFANISLHQLCANVNVDIVKLEYLHPDFGLCLPSDCGELEKNITACQKVGKKILLSPYSKSPMEYSEGDADDFWATYGPIRKDEAGSGDRPFRNVSFHGVAPIYWAPPEYYRTLRNKSRADSLQNFTLMADLPCMAGRVLSEDVRKIDNVVDFCIADEMVPIGNFSRCHQMFQNMTKSNIILQPSYRSHRNFTKALQENFPSLDRFSGAVISHGYWRDKIGWSSELNGLIEATRRLFVGSV